MGTVLNLIGHTYHDLTVIEFAGNRRLKSGRSCNSAKNDKYITELAPEIRRKLIDASCAF